MPRNTFMVLMAVALVSGGFISYEVNDALAADTAGTELATVCVRLECGYVNSQGEWQIPPKFRAADPFSENGLARVIVATDDYRGYISSPMDGKSYAVTPYAGNVRLINTRGDFVGPADFWMIRGFAANGLAAVQRYVESETGGDVYGPYAQKWGFVDTKGRLVIEARFDLVRDFSDYGLAAAIQNGQWGFINNSGQWVVEPKFDAVKPFFTNGLALAHSLGDEKRKSNYKNEWMHRRLTGKWGLIDTQGQWVLEPVFDRVEKFFDSGLAVAAVNGVDGMYGKYGLIDSRGQWRLSPDLDYIGFIDKDYFVPRINSQYGHITTLGKARKSGRYGFLNTYGQWVVEPQFEEADHFEAIGQLSPALANSPEYQALSDGDQPLGSFGVGRARVKKNGRWGIIDPKDRWVLEAQFDEIGSFYDSGLAAVKLDGKYGIINTEGQVLIPPKFSHLRLSPQNDLIAAGKNGKWGLIDRQGQWVLEPKFDDLGASSGNGLTAAKMMGRWGVINHHGQWVIEPGLEDIRYVNDDGSALAKINGKWGLIDRERQWIIIPQFDELRNSADSDLSYARKRGLWGLLNSRGQWSVILGLDSPAGSPHNGVLFDGSLSKNLRQWYIRHKWPSSYDALGYIDAYSGVYRTGLDKNIAEPGFSWEMVDGLRVLFNRQGDKILTVEWLDGAEVVKNKEQEIIWPQ